MKRNIVLNTVAGVCLLLPTAFAQAEEKSELATIRLTHNVLRYAQVKEEEKDKVTTKTEDSGLQTFPAGIEIAAFYHGYSIYAYPVTEAGSIWVGKEIAPNMEFGLTGTLNSFKRKDGPESSYNEFGVYYFYTRPIGSAVNFEFDFNPAFIMGSSKSSTGGTTPIETKKDASGFSVYFDLFGVVPIAKNFEYAFGLDYKMKTYDEKVKETGAADTTIKHNDTELNLVIAKFRYFI